MTCDLSEEVSDELILELFITPRTGYMKLTYSPEGFCLLSLTMVAIYFIYCNLPKKLAVEFKRPVNYINIPKRRPT
jgi:hypothetical protein